MLINTSNIEVFGGVLGEKMNSGTVNTDKYFKRVNFEEVKRALKLDKVMDPPWTKMEGHLHRSFLPEEESKQRDLSYLCMVLTQATDGYKHRRETDAILFLTEGTVEFYHDKGQGRPIQPYQQKFSIGDAIQIPPPVVRKLIPDNGEVIEIEMIVQPMQSKDDTVFVYK